MAVDVDAGSLRLPLAQGRVRRLAEFVLTRERVKRARLSIAFLSRGRIAALHRRHLGRSGATDVITFAMGRATSRAPIVGDIYVAPEVVREQATRLGVPVRQELARVVIHGVLHALGHSHPDNGRRTTSPMWRRQERLLNRAESAGIV